MVTPALLPLAEKYGPAPVWFAGIEALGWPPTWQPSLRDVLRISEYLEKGR